LCKDRKQIGSLIQCSGTLHIYYLCFMSVIVKNISKFYGKQKALDNVSFEVGSGQVVGFLGPNGAGKSTMMKIITCFIPQSDGTATVCGFDVNDQSIEVRRQVGYLPEHNPLYLDMFVKEYLSFVGGIHKLNGKLDARIKEMVHLTGLEAEQRKRIGALSKGYRQRVGIAQALIHDPQVLILDEPTSGLDPNQLTEIRSLIKSIGKEKTVILSTHIMQEVEAICDRVIIINKGKIAADDSTAVLQNKTSRETITVEFDRPVNKNQLTTIAGVKEAKNISGNTWRLVAIGDQDIRPNIFNWAVQNNCTVLSLQKDEQKLEDIFQKLTRD
jgi:ABC-2 type transport system ATP-binding protein